MKIKMKHTLKLISVIILLVAMVTSISVNAFAESESQKELNNESLTGYFREYLNKKGANSYEASGEILWKVDKYTVFFGTEYYCSPALTSKVIDNYVVLSYNIYYPYDIGYFVYNDGEICTLEQAIEKKYFKMSDIAPLSENINLIFDLNNDDKIDLQDAVKLQRVAAGLEQRVEYHAYWTNYNSDMEAVVKIQQYVAKLINKLS